MDRTLTDEQLRARTRELLRKAEAVLKQLSEQTDALAQAIEQFDREVIAPLRRELGADE